MRLNDMNSTTLNVTLIIWCRIWHCSSGREELFYLTINYGEGDREFKYSKLEDAESDIKRIQEVIERIENPVE